MVPRFQGGGDVEEIDATDLPPISEERLGLGKDVSWTNPALEADRGTYRAGPAIGGPPVAGVPAARAIDRAVPLPPSELPTDAMQFDRTGVGAPPPSPHSAEQTNPIWQSLMAAGLGIAASRSPYALTAIGEGGLTGLSAYEKIKADQLAADRLQQQADYHQNLLSWHQQQAA